MTVLNKSFVSRVVKFLAQGRVGKFRCSPTRSSVHETLYPKKKKRIASLNVGTLRGRFSKVVETMSCAEEAWTSVVFRKSDGVVHLHT